MGDVMSLETIEFWYWWVAAIVFVVIEIFAPGTVALWMGVSAGVVGLLLLDAGIGDGGPKGAPLRPCCCGKRPPGSWPRQGGASY